MIDLKEEIKKELTEMVDKLKKDVVTKIDEQKTEIASYVAMDATIDWDVNNWSSEDEKEVKRYIKLKEKEN